jgi:protein associated with RNAse G/E
MSIIPGQQIVVQSYKHDGSLHRIWQQSVVLSDDEDRIVVANERTKVIEANGRFWFTREPSVTYFFRNRWYNVIGILKEEGISYYCNLASPILADVEAIKYIDYDLDVKVAVDGSFVVLDQNEYRRHRAEMQYPPELCEILEREFQELQDEIRARRGPFDPEDIRAWYIRFQSILER